MSLLFKKGFGRSDIANTISSAMGRVPDKGTTNNAIMGSFSRSVEASF